jgi:hypothetical protein
VFAGLIIASPASLRIGIWDRRAAGVKRPDPADDLIVLGGLLGVLGALGCVPLTGLRRGVVHGLILNRHVPGLAVALLYRQLYGVDHCRGLKPVHTLAWEVAHYLRGRAFFPATFLSTTRSAAASDDQQGRRDTQYY